MEQTTDRLPPHATEAERGVLGCIMLEPDRCMAECLKRLKPGREVFYGASHQVIFGALVELAGEKHGPAGIDVITLQNKLKAWGRLEEVGGLEVLAALPDAVPSAGNLAYYLEIVLEKYFLRKTVRQCTQVVERIYGHEGEVGPLLDAVASDLATLNAEQRAALGEELAPQYLKRANEFAEGAFGHLFRSPEAGEPGLELPIRLPFRIRRGECTLVSADDGAGKSTLLSYFALHLGAAKMTETTQGTEGTEEKEVLSKVCIASFEESPESSLWRLASQLIGRKRLPETDEARQEAQRALSWLNERFWFYDFLGISDWRDVLAAFQYAAEKHGVWLFVLDSVMRIGIADDDYATQGIAAAAFSRFAMDYNAHLIFVIHENKSDGKGKARVRGSKLWTANAHNVCQVERNMEKGEKRSKVEWKIQTEKWQQEPDVAALKKMEAECFAMRKEWDTHFVLRKQRYPGSQQNASKRFWFDRESFQFRDDYNEEAVNWLAAWTGRKSQPQMDVD